MQWLHTERLGRWTRSAGPTRSRLTGGLADALTNPIPTPADAAEWLAALRWLLDHAAAGAPLTQTNYLTRPVVAEGCRRFDWLTLTGNPRSEGDIVELLALRDWVKQMGLTRRSGRQLLLSAAGKAVHAGGVDALWQVSMTHLAGPSEGEAAAAEVALLLLLGEEPLGYRGLNQAVAGVLAEEGWRDRHTDQPTTPDQARQLLADLRRRLDLLGLTTGRRYADPISADRRRPVRRARRCSGPARCVPATASDDGRKPAPGPAVSLQLGETWPQLGESRSRGA